MSTLYKNNVKREKVIKMINDSAKAISHSTLDNDKENIKILCSNLGKILNNSIIFDKNHVQYLSKNELYYFVIILNETRNIFINLINKQINKIENFIYEDDKDDDKNIKELIKLIEYIFT